MKLEPFPAVISAVLSALCAKFTAYPIVGALIDPRRMLENDAVPLLGWGMGGVVLFALLSIILAIRGK